MLGAICGDIIGSIYERYNIKTKEFQLFVDRCRCTDDSVMTAAISKACCDFEKNRNYDMFQQNCIKYMRELGQSHINAGYGGTFIKWLMTNNPIPYNSYGNGSAMRVSPVGWVARSLEEAEKLAQLSAEVTHSHPEGIKGAQSIAGSIWLLLNGKDKDDVKKYVESKYYNLDFTIDEIRDDYEFDVSCQGSVPQAIEAFLEGENYEDVIRNAISIGGDSDTIAAIAGSLAEAKYGIPEEIKQRAMTYLDHDLDKCVKDFDLIVKKKEINLDQNIEEASNEDMEEER